MKKQIYICFSILLLSCSSVWAQSKIKDGTVTSSSSLPNVNAILELESTKRGLLMPRVALQSSTFPAPLSAFVAGMVVYNTATVNDVTPGYYYSDGIKWLKMAYVTPSVGAGGNDLTNDNGIIVTGGNGASLRAASLRLDSNAVARFINQSPVKDSIAVVLTKSPVKDSIISVVNNTITTGGVNGKDLTNDNGIIVTGGTGTSLKATSLRLDSNAVARFINQSPVKDSIAVVLTKSPVRDTLLSISSIGLTADNGLTKTINNTRLGGALVTPTTISTDATNTLSLAGLQSAAATDSVVTVTSTGVLRRRNAALLGGDGDAWGVNGENQISSITRSGRVNIGTDTANASSILELNDTTKALRITRVNLAHRYDLSKVPNPQKAMMVYAANNAGNADSAVRADNIYYFDGTKWNNAVNETTLLNSLKVRPSILGYTPVKASTKVTVPTAPGGATVTALGCKVNPANGHTYCAYQLSAGANFYNTFNLAKQIGGYLVTMTSNAERTWVNTNIVNSGTGYGLTNNIWIGYNKVTYPGNPTIFTWITGEDWVIDWTTSPFSTPENWFASGEPNNLGGTEGSCHIFPASFSATRQWNDLPGSSTSTLGSPFDQVIIEFDEP